MLEIRRVEPFELDTWDAFIAGVSGGTLFHTSTWAELVNRHYGGGRYELTGVWKEGRLVAGFCALVRSRLGVLTAVTPLCTPYTGLIITPGLDAEAKLQILTYLRRYRFQYVQCSPALQDQPVLHEAGYHVIQRRTLELNLSLAEEELWMSFDGHVRRNIRKAEKSGYDITDQWNTGDSYEIFCSTFERQGGSCPVAAQWFNAISTGVELEAHRRRYTAWQGDKLAAILVVLRWGGRVYYELAAVHSEHKASGIASLLIWQMLREHLGRDWTVFDFVGGNLQGIAKFKEGFNPSVRPHLALELCLSKRIRFGRAMRDLLTQNRD